MENSKAYQYLFKQLNASGAQKRGGYYPKIMEEIYDWERDEVEEAIWRSFHRDDEIELAQFLPKLKKYDGVKALQETLVKCRIPCDASVTIARVLYEYTGDDKYLDVIKQNIDKDIDEIFYVGNLADCKPCQKAYDFLVEIYLKSSDKTIINTAVVGILYNKGVITDPMDMQEYVRKIEIVRKFDAESVYERQRIIRKFENGEL